MGNPLYLDRIWTQDLSVWKQMLSWLSYEGQLWADMKLQSNTSVLLHGHMIVSHDYLGD